MFDDPGDVSDAVGVGIPEALWVNLIENGVGQPSFVCFMPGIRPAAVFDNVCNYALQYNH